MYGFPRLHFSKSQLTLALEEGVSPDFKYCMELVNETGIMTVPGSGFGQKEGEYHMRVTNLVCPYQRMEETMAKMHEFNKRFHEKYQ